MVDLENLQERISALKDVTDETFAIDVMERSKVVPVVVDLWAPWCQPCKALGPILEKVVGTTEGKVDLVLSLIHI